MNVKIKGTIAAAWTHDGGERSSDPLQRYVIKNLLRRPKTISNLCLRSR
jgi:hypothetical protein